MEKYLKEVKQGLKKNEDKERAKFIQKYMNTQFSCFGIGVPQQRKLIQTGYSFSNYSEREVNKIWDYIWKNGKQFEVLSQCLLYYQYRKKELDLSHWSFLKQWGNRIDNWEHSDRLSDIYAELHEKYPSTIFPEFRKWNKSKKSWLRRLSIVSLFYYAAMRDKKSSYSKVLPMVDSLLYDEDAYVQKGVGWTLRELYNLYPQKTYKYLIAHASDVSPTAWQASTEKLSKREKDRLKTIRLDK